MLVWFGGGGVTGTATWVTFGAEGCGAVLVVGAAAGALADAVATCFATVVGSETPWREAVTAADAAVTTADVAAVTGATAGFVTWPTASVTRTGLPPGTALCA